MTNLSSDIQSLQSLNLHSGDVVACDFGDNNYLATGSRDKTVIVWEWKPGSGFVATPSSPLIAHKYAVTCVKFSPQVTLLATSSIDGSTLVWNVKNGECLLSFVQNNGVDVRSCCFSSDAKILISCDTNGVICVWSLIQKILLQEAQGHEETISCISISHINNVFTTVDISGGLKVWALPQIFSSCTPIKCLLTQSDIHDLGVNFVDIAKPSSETCLKSDSLVTCGNDNLIKVWSLWHADYSSCNLQLKWKFVGHSSVVTCVRFNHDATLVASVSLDKTTKIWEVKHGTCYVTLEGHHRYVACCAFSRDGSFLVTGASDKCAMVWNLTGEVSINSKFMNQASGRSSDSQFVHDIERAVLKQSELESNVVKIWQRLNCLKSRINSCCFSSNHFLVAGGSDKLIYVWRPGHNNRFVQVDMSPFIGHQYAVSQVDVSPCGQLIASCSVDGSIILWEIESGKQVLNLSHCVASGLKGCCFSSNAKYLAAASNDENIFIFDTKNGHLLESLGGHYEGVQCVAFTHDSQYIASGCAGGHLRAWGIAPLCSICISEKKDAHDLGVSNCDFAPADNSIHKEKLGYMFASCGNDSLVKLWIFKVLNELQGKFSLLSELSGHGGAVTCVRFSPHVPDVLASTASDKTARIWNTKTSECVNVIDYRESMLTSCAFSFSSEFLATSSLDKSIVIWELSKDVAFSSFVQARASLSAPSVSSLSYRGPTMIPSTSFAQEILNSHTDGSSESKLQLKYDLGLITNIPDIFLCPITHQVILDPVLCEDGYTYERSAIEEWFSQGGRTSPMTNKTLHSLALTSNAQLKHKIIEFSKLHGK